MPRSHEDINKEILAEQALEQLLHNIQEYRKKIDAQKSSLDWKLIFGSSKKYYFDKVLELMDTAKNDLAEISKNLTVENVSTKSGVAEIQKLIDRGIENINTGLDRIEVRPGGNEAERDRRINDFCSDIKTWLKRMFEDVKSNLNYIYKAITKQHEEEDKPYEATAKKNLDSRLKTSLVTKFKDERTEIDKIGKKVAETGQALSKEIETRRRER